MASYVSIESIISARCFSFATLWDNLTPSLFVDSPAPACTPLSASLSVTGHDALLPSALRAAGVGDRRCCLLPLRFRPPLFLAFFEPSPLESLATSPTQALVTAVSQRIRMTVNVCDHNACRRRHRLLPDFSSSMYEFGSNVAANFNTSNVLIARASNCTQILTSASMGSCHHTRLS